MDIKERVRPYYGQLISLLDQMPGGNEHYNNSVYVSEIKDQLSDVIARLKEITGEDYSAFAIKSEPASGGREPLAKLISIKAQLAGLLGRLGGKYFSDEQKASAPGTHLILTQSQSTNQSVNISIVDEMSHVLSKKSGNYVSGSKEGKFIEKLKESLGTVQSISQLILAITSLATKIGITPEALKDIFS